MMAITEKHLLLILLLTLLVKSMYVDPFLAENMVRENKYTNITRHHSKLRAFQERVITEKEFVENVRQVELENMKYFLTKSNGQQGVAKVESLLTGLLKGAGMSVVSSTFGKIIDDDKGYVSLPVSFRASGSPKQFNEFLKNLRNYKPILKIVSMDVSKQRGSLRVRGQVNGFGLGIITGSE